jgi:putative phosphoribosyl transferase
MIPIRHVLAAIDFHPASLRALGYAVRLARGTSAKLTLLHAFDPVAQSYPLDVPSSFAPAELLAVLDRELGEILTSIRSRGVDAQALIREASPATAILAASDELDADLIVLGTRGRHGLGRLFFGSVAEQVVRRSAAPVVTLHEWHFEDRAEASRKLVRKVAPLRGEYDVTIALTRGAVPIAIDIARAIETPLDVLLVEPIATSPDTSIGAACEDGSFVLDQSTTTDVPLASAAVDSATDAALSVARLHARWLADPDGPRRVTGERVLIVSDRIATPAVALVAARALALRGAASVSFAVPVCASSLLAKLQPAIETAIYIESTEFESRNARVFHEDAEPSNIEASEMLVHAAHRREAPQPRVSNA